MATACEAVLGLVIEGESVGRRNRFFDEDGQPWDPPTIDVTLVSPSGVATNPAPVAEDVGVYVTTFTFDEDGAWRYRIKPNGGLNRVDQGTVMVARSNV